MPCTIAFLSKYPPMEGGISSRTYWLARGLANRGHKVHIITHPPGAAREYRIQGECRHPESEGALQVHHCEGKMPWHLPEDEEQSLALLDLTLRVLDEHQVQIIDTGYLVPYGIVGHLAKMSTGVRHVMRHGGSDLEKFLKARVLGNVISEALSKADLVITDIQHRDLLERMASHLTCQPPYVPDAAVFQPNEDNQRPRRRLASIGKINCHWQHKGLQYVADIIGRLKGTFECSIVGQGNGATDFRRSLAQELSSFIDWRPFVPPWEMPNLLNQLDAVLMFESGLPYPVTSNLVLEAAACGVDIITDRPDFAETYRDLVTFGENQVLVVSPSDPLSAAEAIAQWVLNRASSREPPRQLVSYQEYVSANEALYEEILSRRC